MTINNAADVGGAIQSVKQADIDANDWAIISAGTAGNGVFLGCAVTATATPDLNANIAAGLIRVSDKSVVVAAGAVARGAAHATLDRFDLVAVDSSGTKSIVAGTAATSPVFPAIPANSVILAAIFVPANATTINTAHIQDKRQTVIEPVRRYKAADENVNSSTTMQDDDDLQFDGDANSMWLVEITLLYVGNSTGNLKIGFAGPSGFDINWNPIQLGNTGAAPSTQTSYWGAGTPAGNVTTPRLVGSTLAVLGSTSVIGLKIYAVAFFGSTAGTCKFQWAQNTSNGTNTTMKKGSNLIATRLGV